jgi:hypothetical protein
MIVVAMIVGAVVVVVMGMQGVSVRTMSVVVMLDGVAARVARMGPEQRDQAGENGAQQRQENDCLDH